MPADYFVQGSIQVFVKPRWYEGDFMFLGTAITDPTIKASYVYRDVQSERVQPGPYNKMIQTEQHVCSMVLNRVNHRTWNRIRNIGVRGGIGDPLVRRIESGQLVIGSSDFQLFFKYAHPFANVPQPDAAPKGRLYYSSVILDYEEDSPSRVQELTVVMECNPLPFDHKLLLFTERETDFPTVTAE